MKEGIVNTRKRTSKFSRETRSLRYVSMPSVFGTMLNTRSQTKGETPHVCVSNSTGVEERQRRNDPHFCPKNVAFVFVALHFIPSYVTSTDCATALHQKGGALMVKSRIVPRVALKTVRESGRPSPSSRVCDWKYSHQGYVVWMIISLT